jgi:hypothetical protein
MVKIVTVARAGIRVPAAGSWKKMLPSGFEPGRGKTLTAKPSRMR